MHIVVMTHQYKLFEPILNIKIPQNNKFYYLTNQGPIERT